MRAGVPETRYARSGELSIAYQVVGEGEVDVVLVPGFVSHLDLAWEHPLRSASLLGLASFSRVITFDKRGTGLSDRTVPATSTIEERMDDIRAVMDAAGSERAAIVGYSEGGPLAIAFAATYPTRVTALVLGGTFASIPPNPRMEEWLSWIERWWGTGRPLAEIFNPGVDREWAARFERSSATPRAAAALLRLSSMIDVTPALPAIGAPTLVIHRRGDPVVPVARGRDLAARIPGAKYVELDADTHMPASTAEWADELGEIEEFVTGARHVPEPERVLATVLFTDIVSSTERAAALGDRAWRDLLVRHHDEIARVVERYKGRRVKSTGDGVLATFDGPTRAVRCAVEIVDGARTAGVELRAGLHTGEVEVVGDDIAGIAVHLAQRVEAKAEPGAVYVSQTVRDLLAGSDIELADRGAHELKGVPGEWRLYAIS